MDRILLGRVKTYLSDSNKSAMDCLPSDIAPVMRGSFSEYNRLKKNVLNRYIESTLKILKKQEVIASKMREQSENSKNSNKVLTTLYTKHTKQQPKENDQSSITSASISVEIPSENQQKRSDNAISKKKSYQFVDKPTLIVPKLNFSSIGGLKTVLRKVCQFALQFLHSSEVTNIEPASGLLITGPSGCGKTLTAEAFCGELSMKMLKISCPELVSSLSGDSENKIREMFEFCKENSPCVLFLDDIESILRKRESSGKQMEVRIISQFVHCFDSLISSYRKSKVLVLGTTSSADNIDPILRRAGRFDTEIALGMPNIDERVEIMQTLCTDLTLRENFDFESIAVLTPGFVGADLKALIREASLIAFYRDCEIDLTETSNSTYGPEYDLLKKRTVPANNCESDDLSQKSFNINEEDFCKAISKVQPSSKREGFITVPNITWQDVGALHSVRKELQLAIIYPVKHRHLFQAFSLSSPPGILLTGPPGCGKTMLAKAVANEAGINFISVKGPELLNMYLGESERAVRQVFSRAKNSAPCVIFFDEIDALCPKRKDTDHGSRVVQQFLTELDGVESREGVFILAATNRPDVIDSALLRPGRFDKILSVPVPSVEDRADILGALTKNGTKPQLSAECNLAEIAQHPKCDKFSGADMAALVREASINALQEVLKEVESSENQCSNDFFGSRQTVVLKEEKDKLLDKCLVSKRHFESAFSQVKSSVAKSDFAYSQFFSKKC